MGFNKNSGAARVPGSGLGFGPFKGLNAAFPLLPLGGWFGPWALIIHFYREFRAFQKLTLEVHGAKPMLAKPFGVTSKIFSQFPLIIQPYYPSLSLVAYNSFF